MEKVQSNNEQSPKLHCKHNIKKIKSWMCVCVMNEEMRGVLGELRALDNA